MLHASEHHHRDMKRKFHKRYTLPPTGCLRRQTLPTLSAHIGNICCLLRTRKGVFLEEGTHDSSGAKTLSPEHTQERKQYILEV